MNDTQRLDALGEYGLCLVRHDELVAGRWLQRWVVNYGVGKSLEAPTEREAIDRAVADLQAEEAMLCTH